MRFREFLRPGRRKTLLALIVLPLILASIVLGSLQASRWMENWLGFGANMMFELAFTLGGFLVALLIVKKVAEWFVKVDTRRAP